MDVQNNQYLFMIHNSDQTQQNDQDQPIDHSLLELTKFFQQTLEEREELHQVGTRRRLNSLHEEYRQKNVTQGQEIEKQRLEIEKQGKEKEQLQQEIEKLRKEILECKDKATPTGSFNVGEMMEWCKANLTRLQEQNRHLKFALENDNLLIKGFTQADIDKMMTDLENVKLELKNPKPYKIENLVTFQFTDNLSTVKAQNPVWEHEPLKMQVLRPAIEMLKEKWKPVTYSHDFGDKKDWLTQANLEYLREQNPSLKLSMEGDGKLSIVGSQDEIDILKSKLKTLMRTSPPLLIVVEASAFQFVKECLGEKSEYPLVRSWKNGTNFGQKQVINVELLGFESDIKLEKVNVRKFENACTEKVQIYGKFNPSEVCTKAWCKANNVFLFRPDNQPHFFLNALVSSDVIKAAQKLRAIMKGNAISLLKDISSTLFKQIDQKEFIGEMAKKYSSAEVYFNDNQIQIVGKSSEADAIGKEFDKLLNDILTKQI